MATLKGAFINVAAGLLGAMPNLVVFQYNPERVVRTPRVAYEPDGGAKTARRDGRRQTGPPNERYTFTLDVDATDQIAGAGPLGAAGAVLGRAAGVLPALSALEMLMVPKSALTVDLWRVAGRSAPYQIPPQRLPTVLLFWGPQRIWPVNVTELEITETEYDVKLTPVRAQVAVSLVVLTPNRLAGDKLSLGAYRFSAAAKETLAALNAANAAAVVGGILPELR